MASLLDRVTSLGRSPKNQSRIRQAMNRLTGAGATRSGRRATGRRGAGRGRAGGARRSARATRKR